MTEVFCWGFLWKHDDIFIKSTTIDDFISNHTLHIFFEVKPSDLCWTKGFNIRSGIYWWIYLRLQEDHGVQRQMNPSLDCWPTRSHTGRLRKNGCQLLHQPLVGAALLSFFGVVTDCLELELDWINTSFRAKLNFLPINSIQLTNIYISFHTFISGLKVFSRCFLMRISGKMLISHCDVCHSDG